MVAGMPHRGGVTLFVRHDLSFFGWRLLCRMSPSKNDRSCLTGSVTQGYFRRLTNQSAIEMSRSRAGEGSIMSMRRFFAMLERFSA